MRKRKGRCEGRRGERARIFLVVVFRSKQLFKLYQRPPTARRRFSSALLYSSHQVQFFPTPLSSLSSIHLSSNSSSSLLLPSYPFYSLSKPHHHPALHVNLENCLSSCFIRFKKEERKKTNPIICLSPSSSLSLTTSSRWSLSCLYSMSLTILSLVTSFDQHH